MSKPVPKPTLGQSLESITSFRETAAAVADELESCASDFSNLASHARSIAARAQTSAGHASKTARQLRSLL